MKAKDFMDSVSSEMSEANDSQKKELNAKWNSLENEIKKLQDQIATQEDKIEAMRKRVNELRVEKKAVMGRLHNS